MKLKIVSILICLNCYSLFAEEKLHTIGVSTGFGSSQDTFKDSAGQELLVDDVSGTTEFTYNYKFSENWVVDINYLTANSTRASFIFDLFLDNKFSMNEVSLGIKGILPLSEHNDFFVRLDASSYNYKIKNDTTRLIDKNGVGAVAGLGWQYHFDNGLQFNVAYNYHNLGNVNFVFGSLGVAYRF